MRIDLNNFDECINNIACGIPCIFLILSEDERKQFHAILESVIARNELRRAWFAEWLKAILSEADAAMELAVISIEKGGANDERTDHEPDS